MECTECKECERLPQAQVIWVCTLWVWEWVWVWEWLEVRERTVTVNGRVQRTLEVPAEVVQAAVVEAVEGWV